MVAVNVGHRDYGFKSVNPIVNIIPAVEIKPETVKKITFSSVLVVGGVTLAYLLLDPAIVEAAAPYIDLSPVDRLMKIVYDALLKGSLYIATPLLAWSGITLATSGTNTGRRTAAKEIGKWTVIGLGVIAGAPWLASMIYKIWIGIF